MSLNQEKVVSSSFLTSFYLFKFCEKIGLVNSALVKVNLSLNYCLKEPCNIGVLTKDLLLSEQIDFLIQLNWNGRYFRIRKRILVTHIYPIQTFLPIKGQNHGYSYLNSIPTKVAMFVLFLCALCTVTFTQVAFQESVPCLKLVRIMLQTLNLVHKYTHICSFSKYTFQYQDPLNFADVSIFWQKQYFTQSNIVRAM